MPEIGIKYVEIIEDIMVKNSLTDFDKANLLPTKVPKQVLCNYLTAINIQQ